jgi:hypothetical protein
MNNYEEIKKLLKASRNLLGENSDKEIKNIKNKYGIISERYNILEDDENPLSRTNVMKDIEDTIERETEDEYETADSDKEEDKGMKTEKKKSYRISGGLMTIHAKDSKDLQLTTEDKKAFQETMDEFVVEVAELVDFNKLNLYENNVEWSGKINELDIDFFFSIAETDGVYINGTMIRLDSNFLEIVNKLQAYYEKFKTKWSKVIAIRKKTPEKK